MPTLSLTQDPFQEVTYVDDARSGPGLPKERLLMALQGAVLLCATAANSWRLLKELAFFFQENSAVLFVILVI